MERSGLDVLGKCLGGSKGVSARAREETRYKEEGGAMETDRCCGRHGRRCGLMRWWGASPVMGSR